MKTLIIILSMFQSEYKVTGDIKFQVVELAHHNAMVTQQDGYQLIQIDKEFFNYYYDKPQLKRLVYHELGHALLKLPDGKGIMNPERVYFPMKKNQKL